MSSLSMIKTYCSGRELQLKDEKYIYKNCPQNVKETDSTEVTNTDFHRSEQSILRNTAASLD